MVNKTGVGFVVQKVAQRHKSWFWPSISATLNLGDKWTNSLEFEPKKNTFHCTSLSELHGQECKTMHAGTFFPKFRFCYSKILLFWKQFVI